MPSIAAAHSVARKRVAPSRAAAAAHVDEEAFAHDLSLMIRSGLGLMEALRTISERTNSRRRGPIEELLGALRQGESLSAAMQASGQFGAALLACVRASELTGDLADSLQRFAANAARLRVLRARMVSACVYPALLVVVAALVVLFLLVYVVPRFAMVLESATQEMPLLSRALISLGLALHSVQVPFLVVLALLTAWAGWALSRSIRERRIDGLLLDFAVRLPWIRDHARNFGLAQLTRSAAMLSRSGVPALKALRMCSGLLSSVDQPRLEAALAEASAGAPLADSLQQAGVLDPLGHRIVRIAEQTGRLDTALDRVADVHDAILEKAVERLGRFVEPMLMLAIGTVVGGIVVLMYLPIFQLAASIR